MGALYFALLVDFLVAVAECLADAASGTKGVYCDTLNPSLGGVFNPQRQGRDGSWGGSVCSSGSL